MERKWIFADWKLPNDNDLALIEEMGFTDVVLGMGVVKDSAFQPQYAASRIVAGAEALKKRGVRVHVMSWVSRQRTFIKAMCRWLIEICEQTEAASALLDAEGYWHKGKGITPEDAAALVKSSLEGLSCALGVTGLSRLHKTVRPLLDVCDYGLGQAYSIWKPNESEHWSHDLSTEPGKQQLSSWASWGAADKPLVMGLSNYWAARPARFGLPKMSAEASLKKALEGAIQVGATEVAYWSLKWLGANTAAGEVARQMTAGIPIEAGGDDAPLPNAPSSVQWLLVQLGYDLGAYGPKKDGVDGSWGTLSQRALNDFRKGAGLPQEDGYTLNDVMTLLAAYRNKIGV